MSSQYREGEREEEEEETSTSTRAREDLKDSVTLPKKEVEEGEGIPSLRRGIPVCHQYL